LIRRSLLVLISFRIEPILRLSLDPCLLGLLVDGMRSFVKFWSFVPFLPERGPLPRALFLPSQAFGPPVLLFLNFLLS